MAAPALLALAPDSGDPRTTACLEAVLAGVRVLRPDLRVELAQVATGPAGGPAELRSVVRGLARAGHDEIVAVPLLLSHSPDLDRVCEDLTEAAKELPDLLIHRAAPVGQTPGLLDVLDLRLRESLWQRRVRELDGLVLAAAGSGEHVATQSLSRYARAWAARHRLPVLTAFASTRPPTTGEAVRQFRREGRRHIAVASFFLSPGPDADRSAELALEAGAVAVSAPLGAHPEVARTILARYAVGAVELVPV